MPTASDRRVDDGPVRHRCEELDHLPGHHRLVLEAVHPESLADRPLQARSPGLLRAPRTDECRSVVSPNRLGGSGRSRGFTAPTGGLAAGQVELSRVQLCSRGLLSFDRP